MPKATNEKPLDTSYEELAETFKDPFGKVQTGCYWYWLRGNVSSEGVRKDLEAMKKAGIDRAYIGDIGTGGCKPGPVKTFSPEWEDALQTAFATAGRLGISLGLFNSPGWSQSGGPWVGPEQAMRRFVTSLTVVDGPAERVKLAAPKFECAPAADMRDLFVVACPAPVGFGRRIETGRKSVEGGKALVVELESPKGFVAQGAELRFESGKISGKVKVEAETDGAWKTICEMPFSRVNHGVGVGFAPHSPVLASFAPVETKKFRVTVMPKGKGKADFSSIALTAAPLVARAFEKSLGKMHETPLPMWHEYQWPVEDECAKGTALDPAKAVVLAGKVAPDGTLDWHVPEGAWAIYRFAAAPTGTKNGPANPEATGYEVDKMSREHIAMHFDAYLAKILDRTPEGPRRAIRHAVLDSYEMGGQNYTDGFAEKFRASFGYDPTPYLPALAGMAVSSRADSDRFLWDLRRFVADEVAYSYVGGLRDASNARGLGTWLECYGHWGFPGEFLQYGGQSDEIAGEFWSEGDLGNIENRAASSCAHTYGKRLVWSESNTCGSRPYGRSPADLKLRTDRFFAEGVNATLLHLYTHQPDDRKPGLNAWFGNEFNRNNTWFDKADVFTGYLKRCGHLLRQGLNVADIAYFIGEDAPKMTGPAEPAPPAGRQFDYINAEVLEETATVDAEGRIVLPHGTKYEVLVLPPLDTMRPEMAACVERLVNAGAFVFAPVKPKRSPSLSGQPQSDAEVKDIADRLWGEEGCKDECKVESVKRKVRKYGKGVIASGISLEEALKMRGSEPDVVARPSIAYAHRTMPKAEIYFISNQGGEAITSADVSFRVSGRVPELWDAVTGEIRVADKWREESGRTAVTLSLAKHESAFVVFPAESSRGGAETRSNNNLCDAPLLEHPLRGQPSAGGYASLREINIPGPWTVSFESDALHRGPKGPVVMDSLADLSTSDDPAIKFYSGNVVYRAKFTVPRSPFPVSRATLSFGKVAEIGRVKVNGRGAGGVWTAPFAVPVAGLLKDGENVVEVEVATSWVNRLVGDAALPEADRPTWMAVKNYGPESKLRPAGLVGPVRLRLVVE